MPTSTPILRQFAATTVTTANLLDGSTGTSTSKTSKTGKSTGWGVLWSQGNTTAWAAGGSQPAFGDLHGFLEDDTSFEGKTIQAGTWSASLRISTSSGTVTGVVHLVVGKRSSAGVYTQIIDLVFPSHGFTSTVSTITTTGTQAADVAFVTGDKLYAQVELQITSTSSTSNNATTSLFEETAADSFTTPNIVLNPPVNNTLTASPGSMAITGNPTTLPTDRRLSVNPASYAVTGYPVTPKAARFLPVSPGSVTIADDPATLLYTPGAAGPTAYSLIVSPGSMAITGDAITSPVARKVSASPASMSVTGFATTLPVARKLSVSPRAIVITGSSATLPVARKVTVSPASYAITGVATTSKVGRALATSPGIYTIGGADATLVGPGPPPSTTSPDVQLIPLAIVTHSI